MKLKMVCSLITALMLIATTADAHHSFAMFDSNNKIVLTGEVKEFQWTNPHVWLQLMVADAKGQPGEWSLELGSPNMLARSGIKKNSLKPGDKLTVEVSPLKDGSKGGALTKVTLADGEIISFGAGGNSASTAPQ